MDTTYNGWANYETWNVALWIANDYGLYSEAIDFMKYDNEAKDENPYIEFIHFISLAFAETPDNVAWISDELDYDELNQFMRELVD